MKRLPSPCVHLVFEKEGTHDATLYFVEPEAVVPEHGPGPPLLQLCIEDLAAVVAALQGGTKCITNIGVTRVQMSVEMWEERVRQIMAEAAR